MTVVSVIVVVVEYAEDKGGPYAPNNWRVELNVGGMRFVGVDDGMDFCTKREANTQAAALGKLFGLRPSVRRVLT